VVIEQVAKLQKKYEVILKEKSRLLIQEQNALSLDLEKKIHQIFDIQSLKIFILTKEKNNKSRRCSRTWFRATS
jgi:uncharacterized protein